MWSISDLRFPTADSPVEALPKAALKLVGAHGRRLCRCRQRDEHRSFGL